MADARSIKYSYAGVPTIEDFSNDTSFIRGLEGPYGSGKSSGCVIDIVNHALEQRRSPDGIRHSRWAVVRNTYSQLRDTTIRTVFQWLPPHHFGRYLESKHSYTISAFEGVDLELVFMALDRPDDISKLLSLELTGGWINEGREVPWAIFEAMTGRVGRWPPQRDGGPSWYGIIADTNPPDTDSKWYRFFNEEKHKPGHVALFRQPGGMSKEAENLNNLPGGQEYYRKMSAGKSAEWIKVYVDGEYGFVAEGKLVYPEYADAVHCRSVDPIPDVPIIVSLDFGLTPAAALSQLLPDGRWLTFDEMTSDNMSVDQFGDELLEHLARSFRGKATFEFYGDPAGNIRAETDKRSAFDILRAKGIDIEGAASQEPSLRQEAVRKPLRTLVSGLGEPQFILHPRCRQLRKGFLGGYHRRRMQTGGPERYSEKAEKNQYSHVHDALQYGMVQYFAPVLTERPSDYDPDFDRDDYATMSDRNPLTGY